MKLAVLLLALVSIPFFAIAPSWSLLIGIILTLILNFESKVQKQAKVWSGKILQLSIILVGASLNFSAVMKQGSSGFLVSFMSLCLVIACGELLARLFKVESPLAQLITVGTAICGGSAIGAIDPIIKADSAVMATSLGIIFILNSLAIFIFTAIGHSLQLDQVQFGTWAALAIHDTSSVVAATQMYGEEALKTGTLLKLTRALWIIPVSLLMTKLSKEKGKYTIPWFIFLFIINSLLFSFWTSGQFLIPYLAKLSKTGFSITLLLIGVTLNKEQVFNIKLKPILMGTTLWALTVCGSLIYVLSFL